MKIPLIFYSFVSMSMGIRWFIIQSLRPEPDQSLLVVDVDNDIVDCPGAKLLLCPESASRFSQMWRWKTQMLINRANRMAIDASMVGDHLMMFFPSNSSNQRWMRIGKHLISEANDFAMGINATDHYEAPSLRGFCLSLSPQNIADNQQFQLVEIFKDVNINRRNNHHFLNEDISNF